MFLTNSVWNDILNLENYNSVLTRGNKSVTYYTDSSETNQTISLAVPGFSKSDIVMNTSARTHTHSALNVTTNISEERLNDNPFLFNFRTKFAISKDYNLEAIKASMQDGILTITIPKGEVIDLSKTIHID